MISCELVIACPFYPNTVYSLHSMINFHIALSFFFLKNHRSHHVRTKILTMACETLPHMALADIASPTSYLFPLFTNLQRPWFRSFNIPYFCLPLQALLSGWVTLLHCLSLTKLTVFILQFLILNVTSSEKNLSGLTPVFVHTPLTPSKHSPQ